MSMVILSKKENVNCSDFFAEVESKTGVTIESERNSTGDASIIRKVTFSDGKYVSYFYNSDTSAYDGNSIMVLFDEKSHLFIVMTGSQTISSMNFGITLQFNTFAHIFIADVDGEVRDIMSSNYFYSVFNINSIVKNDQSKQTIKILPAFCLSSYKNIKTGFLKNIYINYERAFTTGLKFIDKSGNEFITLGSYLLYYNGKHK